MVCSRLRACVAYAYRNTLPTGCRIYGVGLKQSDTPPGWKYFDDTGSDAVVKAGIKNRLTAPSACYLKGPAPPAITTADPATTPELTNTCLSSAHKGRCFDIDTVRCEGGFKAGLCPGSSDIKCCPAGKVELCGADTGNKGDFIQGVCADRGQHTCRNKATGGNKGWAAASPAVTDYHGTRKVEKNCLDKGGVVYECCIGT